MKHGALLVACALITGSLIQTLAESAPGAQDAGVPKTALMSFPEFFCGWTEPSAPFAYIGVALQIDGRVRYFKTKTTCQDLKGGYTAEGTDRYRPMFGEKVTVYGGNIPARLRRENGDLYDIEPSESSTTRSYFLPSVVLTGYENPRDLDANPHPELVLRECRLLTDASERDLCLSYQAGLQTDQRICEELTAPRREKCRAWLDNIQSGRINK